MVFCVKGLPKKKVMFCRRTKQFNQIEMYVMIVFMTINVSRLQRAQKLFNCYSFVTQIISNMKKYIWCLNYTVYLSSAIAEGNNSQTEISFILQIW